MAQLCKQISTGQTTKQCEQSLIIFRCKQYLRTIKVGPENCLDVSRVYQKIAYSTEHFDLKRLTYIGLLKLFCLKRQQVAIHECIILSLEQVQGKMPIMGTPFLDRFTTLLLPRERSFYDANHCQCLVRALSCTPSIVQPLFYNEARDGSNIPQPGCQQWIEDRAIPHWTWRHAQLMKSREGRYLFSAVVC